MYYINVRDLYPGLLHRYKKFMPLSSAGIDLVGVVAVLILSLYKDVPNLAYAGRLCLSSHSQSEGD